MDVELQVKFLGIIIGRCNNIVYDEGRVKYQKFVADSDQPNLMVEGARDLEIDWSNGLLKFYDKHGNTKLERAYYKMNLHIGRVP